MYFSISIYEMTLDYCLQIRLKQPLLAVFSHFIYNMHRSRQHMNTSQKCTKPTHNSEYIQWCPRYLQTAFICRMHSNM